MLQLAKKARHSPDRHPAGQVNLFLLVAVIPLPIIAVIGQDRRYRRVPGSNSPSVPPRSMRAAQPAARTANVVPAWVVTLIGML